MSCRLLWVPSAGMFAKIEVWFCFIIFLACWWVFHLSLFFCSPLSSIWSLLHRWTPPCPLPRSGLKCSLFISSYTLWLPGLLFWPLWTDDWWHCVSRVSICQSVCFWFVSYDWITTKIYFTLVAAESTKSWCSCQYSLFGTISKCNFSVGICIFWPTSPPAPSFCVRK